MNVNISALNRSAGKWIQAILVPAILLAAGGCKKNLASFYPAQSVYFTVYTTNPYKTPFTVKCEGKSVSVKCYFTEELPAVPPVVDIMGNLCSGVPKAALFSIYLPEGVESKAERVILDIPGRHDEFIVNISRQFSLNYNIR